MCRHKASIQLLVLLICMRASHCGLLLRKPLRDVPLVSLKRVNIHRNATAAKGMSNEVSIYLHSACDTTDSTFPKRSLWHKFFPYFFFGLLSSSLSIFNLNILSLLLFIIFKLHESLQMTVSAVPEGSGEMLNWRLLLCIDGHPNEASVERLYLVADYPWAQ